MEEDTREKMKRGNGCFDHSVISKTVSSSSSTHYLNDDVTIEILSRLPTKSLMRFKCVCKHWLYLIREDRSFGYLHFERSKARPCVLIGYQTGDNKYTLMTFDMLFEDRGEGALTAATFHTIREIDFTQYDVMLKPVHGLIGFFGETRIDPGVSICNLSTREITPWIETKFLSDLREKCHGKYTNCSMGYDPITKKHKVVGIWRFLRPTCYEVCEVLTVGDNKWRRIDKVIPYRLNASSVSINGSIYYSTNSVQTLHNKKNFIVAFDVGSEKFRTIRVPNYIFDRPGCNNVDVRLLELDGRLGLSIKIGCMPKLWLFDDDRNKHNSTSSWTQVTMELPYSLYGDRWLNPIPGTDQIILTSDVIKPDGKISTTNYHSYNWKKKSFNKIEFRGIPSSVPFFTSHTSVIGTYFENLLPIQNHSSTLFL